MEGVVFLLSIKEYPTIQDFSGFNLHGFSRKPELPDLPCASGSPVCTIQLANSLSVLVMFFATQLFHSPRQCFHPGLEERAFLIKLSRLLLPFSYLGSSKDEEQEAWRRVWLQSLNPR